MLLAPAAMFKVLWEAGLGQADSFDDPDMVTAYQVLDLVHCDLLTTHR